ncbi:MAG: Holliday junction resolvase RuvX [Bacteroidales bacterium]|nr:Holliday junction resolvase RuvX [Bacteroidales bacterium]
MGRIVSIDYGKKRTGIAVTDELQLIANALCTVPTKDIFPFLTEYTAKEKVELFLVGKAMRLDNTDSESARYIEPFVKKLALAFPSIDIARMDERFTSKMAFQTMIDAGLRKKARQNKALVDTLSATILLQSYLESMDYKKRKEK